VCLCRVSAGAHSPGQTISERCRPVWSTKLLLYFIVQELTSEKVSHFRNSWSIFSQQNLSSDVCLFFWSALLFIAAERCRYKFMMSQYFVDSFCIIQYFVSIPSVFRKCLGKKMLKHVVISVQIIRFLFWSTIQVDEHKVYFMEGPSEIFFVA